MGKSHRDFLKAAVKVTAGYWLLTEGIYQFKIRTTGVCAVNDNSSVVSSIKKEFSGIPSFPEEEFYNSGLGGSQRQFLLFGDTNHSDSRHIDYFYSKEHINYLHGLGIKHIFIEQSKDQQAAYDDLVQGEKTPEEFAGIWAKGMWSGDNIYKEMLKRAHSVLYCAEKGIKVHCSDIYNFDMVSKEDFRSLVENVTDMTNDFRDICPDASGITGEFASAHAWRNPIRTIFNSISAHRVIDARNNDLKRAAYIRSIAGNERCAVLYGAGHFDDSNTSFKNIFGKDNCVHIDLYPDEKAVGNITRSGRPDFTYLVNKQKFYQTGDLSLDGLKAPVAQYSRRAFFRRFSA